MELPITHVHNRYLREQRFPCHLSSLSPVSICLLPFRPCHSVPDVPLTCAQMDVAVSNAHTTSGAPGGESDTCPDTTKLVPDGDAPATVRSCVDSATNGAHMFPFVIQGSLKAYVATPPKRRYRSGSFCCTMGTSEAARRGVGPTSWLVQRPRGLTSAHAMAVGFDVLGTLRVHVTKESVIVD